jgi:hypothetical protein
MTRSFPFLAAGFIFIMLVLVACSGGEQSKTPATSQSTAPVSAPSSAPANPQTGMQTAPASGPAQNTASVNSLPTNGKVLKAMHAAGYTYMQVEKDGKEFWIAATMLNVKKDDHVRWSDAAVMKNFTSSTLHRTFDEILFVSNAQLDQ